LPLLHP